MVDKTFKLLIDNKTKEIEENNMKSGKNEKLQSRTLNPNY